MGPPTSFCTLVWGGASRGTATPEPQGSTYVINGCYASSHPLSPPASSVLVWLPVWVCLVRSLWYTVPHVHTPTHYWHHWYYWLTFFNDLFIVFLYQINYFCYFCYFCVHSHFFFFLDENLVPQKAPLNMIQVVAPAVFCGLILNLNWIQHIQQDWGELLLFWVKWHFIAQILLDFYSWQQKVPRDCHCFVQYYCSESGAESSWWHVLLKKRGRLTWVTTSRCLVDYRATSNLSVCGGGGIVLEKLCWGVLTAAFTGWSCITLQAHNQR